MYKIGDRVKVSDYNDNDNYDDFRDKVLIITDIYTNSSEHMGYDESMEGMALYEFITEEGEEIPCALYEYEIEEI